MEQKYNLNLLKLIYLWENFVHRILPHVEVNFRLRENISPKFCKLMSKKHVREVDLTKHIDNVQKFTEDKFHEVGSSSGRPEKVYVKNFSKSI